MRKKTTLKELSYRDTDEHSQIFEMNDIHTLSQKLHGNNFNGKPMKFPEIREHIITTAILITPSLNSTCCFVLKSVVVVYLLITASAIVKNFVLYLIQVRNKIWRTIISAMSKRAISAFIPVLFKIWQLLIRLFICISDVSNSRV